MLFRSKSLPTWYGQYRDERELEKIGANKYFQTRLWHADYALLDETIEILKTVAIDCDTYSIDLEHSFYKSFYPKGVVEVDRIGVSGNIAPNGMYVED